MFPGRHFRKPAGGVIDREWAIIHFLEYKELKFKYYALTFTVLV